MNGQNRTPPHCPLCLAFLSAIITVAVLADNAPQPCPENAIVLTGSDYPQFVYSPYDEMRQYPPNTDCRFVLVARSLQHRIHVTVIESRLEEPLFTDCKDYVSIKDGGLQSSQEILRWCGSYYPPSLTSSGDSLYIHFHSDNIVQSRGFNLSFVDYIIPGCPPDWIADANSVYCYKLFDSAHGYTFSDAQRACYYERANLLTIENAFEYQFIVAKYSDSHRFPWIGYNDANREGVFDAIDPNVPMWPEDFLTNQGDHKDRDCVFLDWNVREGTAHTIDDCRTRHAFICKKRQDGTTVPIQLSSTLLRHGLDDSVFNYTLLLFVLLLLLILLIIAWIVWQKCKRNNQIAASEGSRLVPTAAVTAPPPAKTKDKEREEVRRKTDKSKTAATDAVKRALETTASRTTGAAELALRKTDSENFHVSNVFPVYGAESSEHAVARMSDSPRLHITPNQPQPVERLRQTPENSDDDELIRAQRRDSNPVQSDESDSENEGEGQRTPRAQSKQRDRSRLYETNGGAAGTSEAAAMNGDGVQQVSPKTEGLSRPGSREKSAAKTLGTVLAPVGEPSREPASSSHRSRGIHPQGQFDRPHVGTLENVSAISLDEFWQDNK